jgi:hypothetical protein
MSAVTPYLGVSSTRNLRIHCAVVEEGNILEKVLDRAGRRSGNFLDLNSGGAGSENSLSSLRIFAASNDGIISWVATIASFEIFPNY